MTNPDRRHQLDRRTLLRAGLAIGTIGPAAWAGLLAGGGGAALAATGGDSPWGPLGPPDANGLRLPPGFRSRIVARSGRAVSGTGHVWHHDPDGGGCVSRPDGGWVYVSNAERSNGLGGVSAIAFADDGAIESAYSILAGTSRNCSGGLTPAGTWLSCEELVGGQVYECSPLTPGQGVKRPALGAFAHEAAAVDPSNGVVYLTEDDPDGRLYRFVPDTPGDLSSGTLQAARTARSPDGLRTGERTTVTWQAVSASSAARGSTTTAFHGGEGAWVDGRRLLFTTKLDKRVWELGLDDGRLGLLHDCIATPTTPLNDVDNLIVHQDTGDVFIAEDPGNMELVGLRTAPSGRLDIWPMVQIPGHEGSEVTGPAFTPDGTRLYLSSQRGVNGAGGGVTYEVSGPFAGSGTDLGLRRAVRIGNHSATR